MANAWIEHIRKFAREKGITYSCALSDPECKTSYKRPEKPVKPVKSKKSKKSKSVEPLTETQVEEERLAKLAKLQEDWYRLIQEGNGLEGKGLEDFIKSIGTTAGKPYEISGINPFTAGFTLGHDVIAPELMKVLPPEKVKKTLRGKGVSKAIEHEATNENIKMKIREKRGRPAKYSTLEERKKAKSLKTMEAYKRRQLAKKNAVNLGEGVFSGESPFNPIANLKKRKEKIEKIVKTVVTGKLDFTSKTKGVIDKHANSTITAVKLHRTPLGKTLMNVLELASGNTLKQKIANSPYDKLFHLFMCIETSNGSFSIEKNEVINAEASCKLPPYTETRTISNIPNGLTVEKSLENTKNKLGDKFLSYEASNNNCQHFVTAFLQANNIGDSSDIAFVKQDTESLFEGNSVFKKIVDSVTNLGSAFSNIIGSGMEDPCWTGYKQIGMKKKRGKKVPNCVPILDKTGSGIEKNNIDNSIMPNKWIMHVKEYCEKNGVKYRDALKDPACKSAYKSGSGMPSSAETMVAQVYNSENLGANTKGL